jgi:hypothetical protein
VAEVAFSVTATEQALQLARAATEQARDALDYGRQLEVVNKRLAGENARLLAVIHRHYPIIASHVIALDAAGDPAADAWAELARDFHAALANGLRIT